MMITQQYDRIEMVKIRMEEAITETRMLPGYPNPFNPAAIIQYQLKVSGDIRIEVYDSIGRRVQVLADGFQPSGQHQVSFQDRKSTRLNSSHVAISYAVFCLKKIKKEE